MNPAWRQFLSTRGATAARVFPGGAPHCARTDLSHLGVIEVHGAEATAFLHGQFTSDVSGQPEHQARISAWCSARGLVIATVLLLRLPGRFFIFVPREACAAFAKRLAMYVLRAEVHIVDRSSDWVRFGVLAAAEQIAATVADAAIPAPWHAADQHGLTVLHLPGTDERLRLLYCGELEAARKHWERLDQRSSDVAPEAWQLQDILAGIPWLTPGLAEKFLPQELSLDSLGALSLSKGCYPGQEIIARVHYRGRAKRGMFRFTVEMPEPPLPGTVLIATPGEQRAAGTVLCARTVNGPLQAGLAVCELELAGSGRLHLDLPGEPPVRIDMLIK